MNVDITGIWGRFESLAVRDKIYASAASRKKSQVLLGGGYFTKLHIIHVKNNEEVKK